MLRVLLTDAHYAITSNSSSRPKSSFGGEEPTNQNGTVCHHGRRSRVGTGGQVPLEFGAGGLSPHILSCCKILSTTFLALQCRKMCFCLYSRTFMVSLAMRPPPEFQSDLRLCLSSAIDAFPGH